MTQHGKGKLVEVAVGHVETPLHQCLDLGGGNQRLPRAGACAEPDIFFCRLGRTVAVGMRCRHKHHGVSHDLLSHGYGVCRFSHFQQLLAAASHVSHFRHGFLRHVHYLHQLVYIGVVDNNFEHKSVHLRFGQRIGSVLFYGVLRRKHEERLVELSRHAHNGNSVLLHRFEQRGLCFGSGSVDFVRKNYVAEYRTGLKAELRIARFVLDYYVGARYVRRHKVGRKLYS